MLPNTLRSSPRVSFKVAKSILKESFFATCERDPHTGRCMPGTGGGSEGNKPDKPGGHDKHEEHAEHALVKGSEALEKTAEILLEGPEFALSIVSHVATKHIPILGKAVHKAHEALQKRYGKRGAGIIGAAAIGLAFAGKMAVHAPLWASLIPGGQMLAVLPLIPVAEMAMHNTALGKATRKAAGKMFNGFTSFVKKASAKLGKATGAMMRGPTNLLRDKPKWLDLNTVVVKGKGPDLKLSSDNRMLSDTEVNKAAQEYLKEIFAEYNAGLERDPELMEMVKDAKTKQKPKKSIEKASMGDLLRAIKDMGGFAYLPELGRKLGLSPQGLHMALQRLRMDRVIAVSAYEGGRGAISAADEPWLMPDAGMQRIGYVALRE